MVFSKRCNKCRWTKAAEEFRWHPSAGNLDKLEGTCSECMNEAARLYRQTAEGQLATAKRGAKYIASEKGRAHKRAYYMRPEVRARRNEQRKAARHKRYIQQVTLDAIKAGKLLREPCQVCGTERVDAHHPDYSKPLSVMWLCRKHHKLEHERLKREAKSGCESVA